MYVRLANFLSLNLLTLERKRERVVHCVDDEEVEGGTHFAKTPESASDRLRPSYEYAGRLRTWFI